MAVGDNDLQQIHQWSEDDKKVIRSLSLSWLPLLPSDPSNAYADNPKAIALERSSSSTNGSAPTERSPYLSYSGIFLH